MRVWPVIAACLGVSLMGCDSLNDLSGLRRDATSDVVSDQSMVDASADSPDTEAMDVATDQPPSDVATDTPVDAPSSETGVDVPGDEPRRAP